MGPVMVVPGKIYLGLESDIEGAEELGFTHLVHIRDLSKAGSQTTSEGKIPWSGSALR